MNITRPLFAAFLASTTLLSPVFAGDMIGNCELVGPKGSIPITNPAKPNQLTVEMSLPSPIWYNGDNAETIKDGMEYCLAAEIAYRAGYDKLEMIDVGWDQLVSGQTTDFDMALATITITPDRQKVADFSIPYFSSDMGVLVRSDDHVDAEGIKTHVVGVQQATTGASFATETLGLTNYQIYASQADMFTALRAKQVDAVITDTANVLAEAANSDGKVEVVGQYRTGDSYGAIYQKDNANNPIFDQIIQSIIDDGTMKKLGDTHLAVQWGKNPAEIPYFMP